MKANKNHLLPFLLGGVFNFTIFREYWPNFIYKSYAFNNEYCQKYWFQTVITVIPFLVN
jgi:hypothetical protein